MKNKPRQDTPDRSLLGPALMAFLVLILGTEVCKLLGFTPSRAVETTPVAVKTYLFDEYHPMKNDGGTSVEEWAHHSFDGEPLHIDDQDFWIVDNVGNLTPVSQ